jgi:RNA-binding protein YlmH
LEKNNFINAFDLEEKIAASNIFDKIRLTYNTGRVMFSDEFYTPNIWSKVIKMADSFGINVEAYGVFEQCERRMLGFSCYDTLNFPVKLLKIKANTKYNSVSHRDFLGAVSSIGLDRSKFGDLVTKGDTAFLAVCNDVADYILQNVFEIGRCPCKITEEDLGEAIPKIDFEDINLIATSLRLDCIVSAICKISRNNALELINASKVYVDYNVKNDKSFNLYFGNTISIRGYGKYKLIKSLGNTNKDRVKLLVKKFV